MLYPRKMGKSLLKACANSFYRSLELCQLRFGILDAVFGEDGRPHHFMFYTGAPNVNNLVYVSCWETCFLVENTLFFVKECAERTEQLKKAAKDRRQAGKRVESDLDPNILLK